MNVLIGLALIYLVTAAGNSGRCPKQIFKSDFDLSRYVGVWYEIVRSNNIAAEFGDCNFQQVVVDEDGSLTFNNYQRVGEDYIGASWPGFCDPRPNFVGRCYFRPNLDSDPSSDPNNAGLPDHQRIDWIDYEIISTDYDNYVVVYSCSSFKNSKFEMVWVGGRSKNLDWTLYQDIVINQLGFSLDDLNTNVQQADCPQIPIPV